MNRVFLLLALLGSSNHSFSAYVVDIYGAENAHGDCILKKYTKQVIAIESELAKQREQFNLTGKEDVQTIRKIQVKKSSLIENIKKTGMFLYADFHTNRYQDKKNLYTTIEIIEKTGSKRLSFINKTAKVPKKTEPPDLITKMQEYEELGWKLDDSKQLTANNFYCPVYHCIFGFSHPMLAPYLNIFNIAADKEKEKEKEKEKILNILNNDPDPERRAAAVFIIGHFKDPEEIISILFKHINDKSPGVRNNAIRVMSQTMEKAQITHINVEPFLNLLNSPYGTDRNKALSLLASAPLDKKARTLIIYKGKKDLLALLHLKQPNNHDWAYLLLKKISGKDFGPHNYYAWEQWLSKMNNG
jgi:hypothetical protein